MINQSKLSLWILAFRPKTLPAAAAPVSVGTAVAITSGEFSLLPALAALLGALLLQVAVNLANDYFDFKNSIDSEERLGPIRVTQSGLIPPGQVKLAMIITLILAGFVGIYLTCVGGFPIVIIGVASILSALAYSGGPYPIASHGLGELFVFIFFGPVAVCGTYYVQSGHGAWMPLIASVPTGVLITAIMTVNNLRDIDTDRKAGKNTLAVMLGRGGTITEYILLVLAAYYIPPLMLLSGEVSMGILLPVLSMPMAIPLIKAVVEQKGSALNEILAKTAKLSLVYSLLLSLGIILS